MKEEYRADNEIANTRQKAEEQLKKANSAKRIPVGEIEPIKLLHELQVHQIELEMQNEELRITNENAETASKKYSRLYNLVPSGYFILSKEGKILESNLRGIQLLEKVGKNVINSAFSNFVSREYLPVYEAFIHRIYNSKTEEKCELALHKKKGIPIYILLNGIVDEDKKHCSLIAVDITDHRLAKEALGRENEEKDRALILKTAMDGFWLVDTQGQLLEVNETYTRMSGYTSDELLTMNISDLEANESSGDTENRIKRIVVNGEDRFETVHRRKNGSMFHVEIAVQYQPILGGRFVVFMHDITKRKEAEEAQRENERLLHESQFLAHIGSYTINLVSGTWTASAEIYRIFGIDKSYPKTLKSWSSIVHPDFLVKVFKGLLSAELENVKFDLEYKIIRVNDGQERWMHGTGALEFDENKIPKQIIGTIQDITERKVTQDELQKLYEELESIVNERTYELLQLNDTLGQTQEKYRTVADYTYDWEYWIGPDNQIRYMSPSVERITGYTADEFVSNPQLLDQIIYPDDYALWLSHKRESHLPDYNEKHDNIEFRIIVKNGDIRWIGHVCTGIYINEKYNGLRVSNRDITEKVKAENELLNVTVEVEERERNRFSLELHDDLGPLLSTIKLYFQWLSETDNPEKVKIITEKGNASIERAIQTTREIAHGLGSQIVNNMGYVGAISRSIESINATKKISIDFKFNSSERFSNFLEIILYRITNELINNTLKYARAKLVNIDFKFYKEKNIINFTYTDNGIGFDLAKIESTGSGLGFMNIKQRIKLAKGSIRIESEIGMGIKIFIELPVEDSME